MCAELRRALPLGLPWNAFFQLRQSGFNTSFCSLGQLPPAIVKHLLDQLFNDSRMISPVRRCCQPRCSLVFKCVYIYLNENAVANTAVTVAVVRQGPSHASGTFSGCTRSHLQALKKIFFSFFFFLLRNIAGSR